MRVREGLAFLVKLLLLRFLRALLRLVRVDAQLQRDAALATLVDVEHAFTDFFHAVLHVVDDDRPVRRDSRRHDASIQSGVPY